MNPMLWLHIASGIAAIPLGAIAISARKGGPVHLRAGTWFRRFNARSRPDRRDT
jgi:hypothetical protein